ncbi:unnamed protein product [Moneuplotes crassus]|uniref:ADP/ATP translocase n=1 Tax=Euplotes crassus TaxID=5936 RepID=A0AAD2D1E5_EUPCR|nr:unnamed protein product [Moneuplotes crassus]
MMEPKPKNDNSMAEDFFAGGVAALLSKTLVAPIERVKILLQVQGSIKRTHPENHYKGILDCFYTITTEQGYLSLWRGNLANIYRYFPTQALNFACKEKYKQYLNPYDKEKQPAKFFYGNIISGSAAGATSLLIVYPLDFARTRLAADCGIHSQRQFSSLSNCIQTIYSKEQLRGLYRGIRVSLLGIVVYRGAYFGLYDTGYAILFQNKEDRTFTKLWAFAQVTTLLACKIAYPLDTIRRRLMMQSGVKNKMYHSTYEYLCQIHAKEGILGFFKGGASNTLRSIGGALALVFYSKIKSLIEDYSNKI